MKDQKIKNQKLKGFTLIELLVIIGILIILTAISVPNFRSFQKESDLNNGAEEIINTLRFAQNKTLASEGASQWGVYFDNTTSPHQYILFKWNGVDYDTRDTNFDEIHKLPSSAEFYEINLIGGGREVVFERISGETSQSGNVKIRLISDASKTKTIYIESSGQAGLTSLLTPSDTDRIKDSRHVHFDYNTNAQDAITLKLIFPDYPADNYDIPFQNYLNVDKTEFDWEGTVLVGPAGSKTKQRLRIHTHSLIITAAQFCIHRPLSPDQSYNDKALNILVDGEELIRYAADQSGTVSKGSSFWVEEPELQ